MTCMGIRLFYNLRPQNLILKQFVKNASISTSFLPSPCKEGTRSHNIYQHQAKRYSSCRRINPCVKKKKDDAEKKLKEQQNPKSFWQTWFEPKKRKPPLQTCRKLQTKKQWECEPIPEFIQDMCKDLPNGSCIYKTRGHAFILEVPCKAVPCEKKKTRLDVQLSKIERDKKCIDLEDECNPMPRYSTVGQRLLDLNDRRLHPLYKKLEMPLTNRPKPYKLETKYRCVADEMEAATTKLTKWDLYHSRKKISFADFKMSVLPRYLETREMEYMINTCSNLEFRKEVMRKCKDTKNKYKTNPMTQCPDLDCKRWKNQKPRK